MFMFKKISANSQGGKTIVSQSLLFQVKMEFHEKGGSVHAAFLMHRMTQRLSLMCSLPILLQTL